MLRFKSTVTVLATIGLFSSATFAAPGDTTADVVLGQTLFTTNLSNQGGNASATTLQGNRGILVDKDGNLWVADNANNRVLRYPSASTLTNTAAADLVLGQADFTGSQANRGNAAPAANTLAGPRGVAVDTAGHVYVADSDNKRIVRYDPPYTNGMAAVQVFGQAGSFTTANQAASNAATADNLGNPDGIAVDSAGNVYLADLFLKRVLIYNTPAAVAGNTTADIVIGQPDFTSAQRNQNDGNPVPAANTLNNPEGVAIDSADNLYVADQENNRVLLFKPPLTTNMNATRVFGQPGFTTNTAGTSATSLKTPVGITIDPKSGNLYVADSINNRILEFTDPQNDSTADRVFGQGGDFTTGTLNKGGVSADSIADVGGVACDASGNLFAGDRLNNRVLRFDAPPPSNNNGGGGSGDQTGGTGDQTGGGTTAAPCGACGAGTTTMMPLAMLCWMMRKRRR